MKRDDRSIRVLDSLDESDQADSAYYHSLTPEQRVDILLDLIARYSEAQGEASKRLARVHRVVELEGS